jgi:hypothetical protein
MTEALAEQITNAMSRVVKYGLEAGKQIERQKVEAVLMAYDRALQNPDAKIPTYLHMALESLRTK